MVIYPPIALESLPASPWKNGAGSTRTLAVEPPDAGLDNFLWRISLADVTAPGAFSQFAGIDRTILLWSGEGLVLHTPHWSHTLAQPYVPFSFRGEEQIHSTLVNGPTVDLNVMVRRGAAKASVRIAHETITIDEPVETMIVLSARGELQIRAGHRGGHRLHAGELLRIDQCEPGTILVPADSQTIFLTLSLAALTVAALRA